MNEKTNSGVKEIVVDPNRGLKYVIAIALASIAISVFYTIWDAVDGYSMVGDVFGIIINVVIGLLVLSGQPWMRYLFAGLCAYNLFYKIIFLIRVICGMRTNVFNFAACTIISLIYALCIVVLFVNKDVKAYFTPEEK